MFRHLPPLNSLRAFEAVARTRSFKLAAKELCVTPSAISKQIQTLESFFGRKLFIRCNPGLELTTEGELFSDSVRKILKTLRDETETIFSLKDRYAIHLSVPNYMPMSWLLPKIEAFEAQNPSISVELEPDPLAQLTLGIRRSHIAFWWGSGEWMGIESTKLMSTQLLPACSPKLLEAGSGITKLDDLKNYPWMHTRTFINFWPTWLQSASPNLKGRMNLYYDDAALAYQACKEGEGLIIVGRPLSDTSIELGELVVPLDLPVEHHETLYVVYPNDSEVPQEVIEFVNYMTH